MNSIFLCARWSRWAVAFGLLLRLSVFGADGAPGAEERRGHFTLADYRFASDAAQGGNFETALGRMAVEKSTNSTVVRFGQRMTDDHGKAGKELAGIVSRNEAILPSQLSEDQQKFIKHLASLSGPEFDKAYAALMVKDHEEDLKVFQRAAQEVQDAELKVFASTAVTMVQAHLTLAKDLEDVLHHLTAK